MALLLLLMQQLRVLVLWQLRQLRRRRRRQHRLRQREQRCPLLPPQRHPLQAQTGLQRCCLRCQPRLPCWETAPQQARQRQRGWLLQRRPPPHCASVCSKPVPAQVGEGEEERGQRAWRVVCEAAQV